MSGGEDGGEIWGADTLIAARLSPVRMAPLKLILTMRLVAAPDCALVEPMSCWRVSRGKLIAGQDTAGRTASSSSWLLRWGTKFA